MNILKMVQDLAGNAIVDQASSLLGESKSSTQSAMSAIIPSLVGGLISKSQQSGGTKAIMDLITNNNLDGNMLNNVTSLFGGGNSTNQVTGLGNTMLKGILGTKMGGLTDMIANFSGTNKSSSSSLMSMAMPIIMSVIGKQVMSKGLGVSGLSSLLSSQSDHVKNALPSGLSGVGNLLGFSDFNQNVNIGDTPKVGASSTNWMPWVLGLLAIAGGLYFFRSSASDTVTNVKDKVVETTKDATDLVQKGADAVVETTKDAANAATDVLSDAVKAAREKLGDIKFAAGSAGENMYNFLRDGAADAVGVFRFNNLSFATGSANINQETAIEVDNLAEVLKAYPNVKVEIQGYTDNTGNADSNVKLSQERANTVMKRLLAKGIGAGRLTAVGYGDANPVASNDAEEGRAQNRRIEVKVVSR